MSVTTKKQFAATTNATTTVFSPVGIQLNNPDDLDVYVTLSGGTRVLQLRQSTGSTAQSSHPQVNNTDGLYFPAVSAGTNLINYTLSSDNNTITFNSALPSGAVVFIERRTRDADSAYTTFSSGSTIRATDLNNSSTESNFTAQDARNKVLDIENAIFNGVQPTINGVVQPYISSSNIIDGSIVDADINASAAIAGTKVTPSFGSQNLSTSGTAATGALTVTGNSAVSGNSTVSGTLDVTGDVTGKQAIFSDNNEYQLIVKDSNSSDPTNAETGIAFKTSDSTVQASIGPHQNGVNHLYITNSVNGADIILRTSESGSEVNKVKVSNADTTFTTPVVATGFTIGNAAINEAELEILDGATVSTTELNILDGVTASTSEINLLDGVTSTTSELNILDGVTASTAEINKLDGVTASTAELNLLDGVTATTAELNLNDGQTATPAEVNILDGATLNTSEINKLDGFTGSTTDLNEVVTGKNVVETITGSATDAQLPTAQAVNERIVELVTEVGGFHPIANETSFPTTNPDINDGAGTIVSLKSLSSAFSTGSGVTTHTFTNGAGAGNNVTITGLPASTTFQAGKGLLLETTTTLHTYVFHRLVLDESGVSNADALVSAFNERYYGPLSSNPATRPSGANRLNGDLYFNTSDGKMKVYNGSHASGTWDDVAAPGNFFINTLSSSSGSGGGSATFNGTATRFTLSNPPTSAQQLLVSINGVIQKPNSGTSPSEGFAVDGADIIFASAPATSAPFFIVTIGSSVNIGTPSDNTVTSAKIVDGSIVNGDISSSAAIAGSKLANPISLPDDHKISFGTGSGNNLEIFHESTSNTNEIKAVDGDIHIQCDDFMVISDSTAGRTIYVDEGASRLELGFDGGHDAYFTGSGVEFIQDVKFDGATAGRDITFDRSDNALEFADDAKATFGDGADLEISHDGNNSIINDNGTGELQLQRGGNTILSLKDDGVLITDPDGGAKVTIQAFEGGNATVDLIADEGDDNGDHWRLQSNASDNNFKIQNNTGGSQGNIWQLGTNGNVEQTGNLSIPDDKEIQLGTNDDLKIKHNNTTNKTEFVMASTKNVKFQNATSDNYFVSIGSHESGTDDNRQMLQIHANGQRVLHSDINGNLFNYAGGYFGRVRTDENSPVNEYRNAPHTVNIYSGRTDDATNYRAHLKLCSADFLTGTGDSSILYFTDALSDTATVDHDQDQKFSVKQSGMIEGMSSIYAGRVKSDERSANNVVYLGAAVIVQASYSQNQFTRIRARNTNNTDDVFTADTGAGVCIKFQSDGNGRFDGGADIGNASDYAEYFEWKDGNTSSADRRGITVVMDGEMIRPATDSDDKSKIIGVVSANPAVVGDSAWSSWQEKHKKDAYGSWVTEDKEYLIWNDFTTVSTVDDPTRETVKQPDINDPNVTSDYQILVSDIEKEKAAGRCPQAAIDQNLRITRPSRVRNESYDPSRTYVPRSARKEWDAIGLVGKLVVRRGQPVGTNWILMKSNVGVDPTDNSIVLDKYLVR